MSNVMNVPKYLYGFEGLKIVREKVTEFNLNMNMMNMNVESENFDIELLYDIEANQYEPISSDSADTFLTYIKASLYIAYELHSLDRISDNIYREHRNDMNKLLENRPDILL